jgi:hypothetical protein
MPEFKVVQFHDRTESLPGLKTRDVVRGEIMVDDHGPFIIVVDKKDGWELEFRRLADEQVRRVRSVTT